MTEWKLVEPGLLVLEGTIFRIQYEPGRHHTGDFHMYQGERSRGCWSTLAMAKLWCEGLHKELIEIGAADV